MTLSEPQPKPWLAAILSVVLPGLGHLYAGALARSVAFNLLVTVVALGAVSLVLMLPARMNVAVPLGLVVAVYTVSAVNAAATARLSLRAASPRKRYQRWYVYLGVVVVFLFVQPSLKVLLNRTFAQSLVSSSAAMEPTILEGEHFLVSPVGATPIERGAVVIFSWPDDPTSRTLMRVVGVPNDTLQMRDGQLFVNGTPGSTAFILRSGTPDATHEFMRWQAEYLATPRAAAYQPTRDSWGPLALPRDEYFMMGDNRDESFDSRLRGLVPTATVHARARVVYYSRDRAGGVRWSRIGHIVR